MNEVKERHVRAAIIGYWRCGATMMEMIANSGRTSKEIRKIIKDYLKGNDVQDYDEETNINSGPNEKSTGCF